LAENQNINDAHADDTLNPDDRHKDGEDTLDALSKVSDQRLLLE